MSQSHEGLLERIATHLGQSLASSEEGTRRSAKSLLLAAAEAYGASSEATGAEDLTQPTGFDPQAAALFEAVIEASYLVANADGDFDERERAAFHSVILTACQSAISEAQIEALIADFADLLQEDGLERRTQMIAKALTRIEQKEEVIRVATLLAAVSGGVSEAETSVLQKLTSALEIDEAVLEQALHDARQLLSHPDLA